MLLVCLGCLGSLFSCTTGPVATRAESLPKSVQSFLDAHDWNFSEFRCSDMSDLAEYNKHVRYYTTDTNLKEVWNKYLSVEPRDIWNSSAAEYGIMYSTEHKQDYRKDYSEPIEFAEGQIYLLDLLIGDWLHIPVAFKITRINHQRHILEFTYLEQNKSNGLQEMKFSEYRGNDGKSHTLITHLSYYTSHDGFRDRVLYPDYHNNTIDEYHRSVARASGLNVEPIRKSRIRRIAPDFVLFE